MTKRKDRSKSTRRKRTSVNLLYKKYKITRVTCPMCGHIIKKCTGIKKVKINRKFGGYLCNCCTKRLMVCAVRIKNKKMSIDDLNFDEQCYLKPMLKK